MEVYIHKSLSDWWRDDKREVALKHSLLVKFFHKAMSADSRDALGGKPHLNVRTGVHEFKFDSGAHGALRLYCSARMLDRKDVMPKLLVFVIGDKQKSSQQRYDLQLAERLAKEYGPEDWWILNHDGTSHPEVLRDTPISAPPSGLTYAQVKEKPTTRTKAKVRKPRHAAVNPNAVPEEPSDNIPEIVREVLSEIAADIQLVPMVADTDAADKSPVDTTQDMPAIKKRRPRLQPKPVLVARSSDYKSQSSNTKSISIMDLMAFDTAENYELAILEEEYSIQSNIQNIAFSNIEIIESKMRQGSIDNELAVQEIEKSKIAIYESRIKQHQIQIHKLKNHTL